MLDAVFCLHLNVPDPAPLRPSVRQNRVAFMSIDQTSYKDLRLMAIQGGMSDRIASHELQRRLHSGEATWTALRKAVAEIVSSAPQDHDVLVTYLDLAILEIEFFEPHTFLFKGIDPDGHHTRI